MTEEKEGPSKQAVTVYDCTGCKWLDRRLLKAKRIGKPEYQSNCNHPAEGRGNPHWGPTGRFIGESTRTPAWCPVLKEINDESEQPA